MAAVICAASGRLAKAVMAAASAARGQRIQSRRVSMRKISSEVKSGNMRHSGSVRLWRDRKRKKGRWHSHIPFKTFTGFPDYPPEFSGAVFIKRKTKSTGSVGQVEVFLKNLHLYSAASPIWICGDGRTET